MLYEFSWLKLIFQSLMTVMSNNKSARTLSSCWFKEKMLSAPLCSLCGRHFHNFMAHQAPEIQNNLRYMPYNFPSPSLQCGVIPVTEGCMDILWKQRGGSRDGPGIGWLGRLHREHDIELIFERYGIHMKNIPGRQNRKTPRPGGMLWELGVSAESLEWRFSWGDGRHWSWANGQIPPRAWSTWWAKPREVLGNLWDHF